MTGKYELVLSWYWDNFTKHNIQFHILQIHQMVTWNRDNATEQLFVSCTKKVMYWSQFVGESVCQHITKSCG